MADSDIISTYNTPMSEKNRIWTNESLAVTSKNSLANPGLDFEDDESDNGYFEGLEIRDGLWAMDSIFEDDVTPHVELYITHMWCLILSCFTVSACV